jgi:hypothetical protein
MAKSYYETTSPREFENRRNEISRWLAGEGEYAPKRKKVAFRALAWFKKCFGLFGD